MSFRRFICILFSGAALLQGCSLVDEDMSNCGTDYELDYQLRLVTNITTEIETELSMEADLQVRGLLEDYLKGIFTDYARDVDLSFYDLEPPMPRLLHMSELMNGSESSYTLYLPAHQYRHTAVANIIDDNSVNLMGGEECKTGRLVQISSGDITQPHSTGIFTARKDIDVLSGVDQKFDVRLYMANAASALVMDMEEAAGVKDLSVTVKGFATEFNISDSTYVYPEKDAVIGTTKLMKEGDVRVCFISIHFPSRPVEDTKIIIDDGGESAGVSSTPLWGWTVHATMADGTITQSLLEMYNPLPAGHLKILNVKVHDTGVVTVDDPTVGVSVTLDWNEGGNYNTEL